MSKTYKFTISLLFLVNILSAQSVRDRIDNTVKRFLADSSMKHAILSLYILNGKTNEVVYDLNGETGLAPASCQKIFTSIAAMDLLGHDYRFKTELGYDGTLQNGELNGNLFLIGYGDPTLGSWRFNETKEDKILNELEDALKVHRIKKIKGSFYVYEQKFETQTIPGGWIWDDMGNYYGAGVSALNWRENQYDLKLKPGNKVGEPATILFSKPQLINCYLYSELVTGEKGSGDNAYIYLSPNGKYGFVRGSIPLGVDTFTISGSFPNPASQLMHTITEKLEKNGWQMIRGISNAIRIDFSDKRDTLKKYTSIYTHFSPSLDSINYYFLKRSINLYGEALMKTIAYEKKGFGNTDSGIAIIKKYWQERGIEKSALHIMDGSGLSPQNRVTTHALVTALQYAKTRDWFNSFYFDLPEYNQMKLKSGSIGGARSFAGYHTAKDGTPYTMAIIVNNYDGSSTAIVNKMFLILNELK